MLGVHLDRHALPDEVDFMLGDVQQVFLPDAGSPEAGLDAIAQGLRKLVATAPAGAPEQRE
ncbi:MAG: hypothetical protein KKI08_15640 [Armatimonadetes bacterium]|nr:hypothetical protein [Armatimonadota bacterium]